ncbi:MAG: general secretion pathway protein GspK [Archangiaceae bacterium]|nr:general secretion pathway protein GspK [Archangiaceae bacterium]
MSRRPVKKGRRAERGVALLMVLVGLAVLALLAQENRYNAIVEQRMSTNARDEMRAHYLAKSGIGLARLMLRFQKQMDAIQIPNIGGMLSQLMGGAGGAGGLAGLLGGGAGAAGAAGALGGLGTPQPSTMSIQLWRMAKIDCHMLAAMVPEEDDTKKGGLGPKSSPKFDFDTENPELAAAQKSRKFGGFEGCFDTVITDEEERINLNKLDSPARTAQVVLAQLMTTLNDKKYEFLFEREDSNKVKATPQEVITALRDWIDEDEVGSTLNFTNQGDPFIKGFSDENYNYDKFDPRYRAKNGKFDSLDELYMVHGVNDRFMAAFKDRLTVYPDVNARMNINTDDPALLEIAIRSLADPLRPDPRLVDPVFIDTLIKKIRTARVFALFGMSTSDFVNIIASAGVAIAPEITSNIQANRFIGDKSQTYRIRVEGTAGDVTRQITAVIRLDDALGRLVYWRED